MLVIENIKKSYENLQVLKGINITFNRGEIASIVGKSGAGKTTLLQIIGTLEKPSEGNIFYDDKNVFNLRENELSSFRNNHIGFVFQFHHLLPEFTALENVCMPAFIGNMPHKKAIEKARHLLNILEVSKRENHKPTELSGGEQQRVSVARSLMNDPKIILADEPSGNLDTKTANELHELFFKLRDENKQTFIIVTHNNKLADLADRKITMNDGEIISS
jgi:lipoprotein-releasing system ATP-binding protein